MTTVVLQFTEAPPRYDIVRPQPGGTPGTPGVIEVRMLEDRLAAPPAPPCAEPTPAADCTTRCMAMMDTCDAGPVESTCQYICDAAPTECALSCGEKTACEQLGDWFDVCKLGQQ